MDHYMNRQMDPLGDPQTTHHILLRLNSSIKPSHDYWFRCIDNRNRQWGIGSVPTWTWTQSKGPAQLQILTVTIPLSEFNFYLVIKSGGSMQG